MTIDPTSGTAAPASLDHLLEQASIRRTALLAALEEERTDSYRLFHGATEGRPGLAIDRYGPLLLAQTWQQPLSPAELDLIEETWPDLVFCWNHRGRTPATPYQPAPAALEEVAAHECERVHLVQARHRGADPWVFLDFRAGRRWLAENSDDSEVLNLFAYTATAGIAAAVGGAQSVLNIDFSESSLEVGAANAEANDLDPEDFHLVQADVIPALRQLAGLPVKGRGARRRKFMSFEKRRFDIVVLDPPTFSTSAFGAVDIVRDYAALFKPAVLATRKGGQIVATNHAAEVDLDTWTGQLDRCATKAGRPLKDITVLAPEGDFPSPDKRPPLKIVIAEI